MRCIKISATINEEDFNNLIEKLKAGDISAFDEIYKRCHRYIAFVCSKFCDNKEDIEEIVQDTFVIAFRKSSEIKADTLLPYLRKIATNECFRKRKKNIRHREHVVNEKYEALENYADADTDFSPEGYLQKKESQLELAQALEQLPKKQREIVYLYYYIEMPVEDIARTVGCSIDSVYKTLQRARVALKTKLKGVVAIAPLIGAFMLMEEEAFAAAYTQASTTASTTSSATSTSVAKICGIGLGIAACVCFALVGIIHFSPSSNTDGEAYKDGQHNEEDIIYIAMLDDAPEELLTSLEGEFEHAEENPYARVHMPPNPQEKVEAEELVENDYEPKEPPAYIHYESEDEKLKEPTQEVEDVPQEEQATIDRTDEILKALSLVEDIDGIYEIINYFDFIFDRNIWRHSTGELLRFYVINEGSGDILVATATSEAGNATWRMNFKHYKNGYMPSDILELLRFIE